MRETQRTEEIIEYARDLRANWSCDPFVIADICGIRVFESAVGNARESSTISMKGYPTIISLYGCNTPLARRIICAHELGHALLHTNMTINRFNGTIKGIHNRCEYEANLFAVALIFNEDEFNTPFSQMDNWTLKMILDYNLE